MIKLNLTIKIKTTINPLKLLDQIKLIETKMGRVINPLRNQPRLIDIDILSYDDVVFNSQFIIYFLVSSERVYLFSLVKSKRKCRKLPIELNRTIKITRPLPKDVHGI